MLNVAAINASAATIALLSSLKRSPGDRDTDGLRGAPLDAPMPLLEADRIESAVIAAALPAPIVGTSNATGAWMSKAASALRGLRRRNVRPGTCALHSRCASFFTLLATEALIAGSFGVSPYRNATLGPNVGHVLSMLSRVELIVLSDNLAVECVALPHDAPAAWWNRKIVAAREDLAADPDAANISAVLLLACAA